LAKVKTGGSIYVQMPKVMKAITISDDSESDEEQEQESKQQPKDKQPVVETDEDDDDEDDEDEDEEDQEDDYMPYISRETVDGYLVSIIGHLEEYT
jgi:TATA-binding protein-associated factor Taf7